MPAGFWCNLTNNRRLSTTDRTGGAVINHGFESRRGELLDQPILAAAELPIGRLERRLTRG